VATVRCLISPHSVVTHSKRVTPGACRSLTCLTLGQAEQERAFLWTGPGRSFGEPWVQEPSVCSSSCLSSTSFQSAGQGEPCQTDVWPCVDSEVLNLASHWRVCHFCQENWGSGERERDRCRDRKTQREAGRKEGRESREKGAIESGPGPLQRTLNPGDTFTSPGSLMT
jgi:hypothetical protein